MKVEISHFKPNEQSMQDLLYSDKSTFAEVELILWKFVPTFVI